MTTPEDPTPGVTTPEGKSIDEIMACIRQEAGRNTDQGLTTQMDVQQTAVPAASPASHPGSHPDPHPAFQLKATYILDDFLSCHDEAFIKAAYMAILKRSPDPDGQASYLKRLQSGDFTKTEILGWLRYSPEGRSQKVHVKGLLVHYGLRQLYRIPVLGRLVRILAGIWNLPTVLKNVQNLEHMAQVHIGRATDQARIALDQGQQVKQDLARFKNQAGSRFAVKTMVEENFARVALKTELEKIGSDAKSDRQTVLEISRQTRDHGLTLVEIQRRTQLFLDEARTRLPKPFSSDQLETLVNEEDHLLESMYVSFEDKFRGTRRDIKQRVSVYLPDVKEVLAQTGAARVLDVGCGRGEWLEVLKENKIKALGLDMNRIMVSQCRDRGFEVVESEVIAYLRRLEPNSLGMITGFHIIEHLPQKTLIALLDESFRVLKPRGMIIFETPNPENILVGAHYFYTDPSHLNPLVPSTMQFIAEQRGFDQVKIRRLHKYSDYHTVLDADAFKTAHVYNEMDFAVMGIKA